MAKFDITTLDPTQMADWQIAEEAEKYMTPVTELADNWGILKEELLPYGHYIGKVDFPALLKRLENRPNGKYIDVTAITPTPLGEGKSTTTMDVKLAKLIESVADVGTLTAGTILTPSAHVPA